MEDKVSLVKEKINDSIVKLFSYLPEGGFYTYSEFDEITRELTITCKHTPRRFEGKPISCYGMHFIFGNFIHTLKNSLLENEYVIKGPEPLIEVEFSPDITTLVTVKCRIRR